MAQLRIRLPSEDYAQLRVGQQGKQFDEDDLRKSGAKHANLWAKGEIYPRNPFTGKHPKFNSIAELVQFVCEGKAGLLGYCESMVQYNMQTLFHMNNLAFCLQQKQEECLNLTKMVDSLVKQVEVNDRDASKVTTQLRNRILQLEEDMKLMDFVVNQSNRESLIANSEAKKHKIRVCMLERRLKRLKQTCFGLRERKKNLKPISTLNPTCGAVRKRICAIRDMVHGKKDVQADNEKDTSAHNIGKVMRSFATKGDLMTMLNAPENGYFRKAITNMVVQDICSKIDIGKIQAICDSAGISTKAYRLLFKPFYDALSSLGTKSFIVPRPYYVHKVRAVRNNSINEVFGCMHSILSSLPIASKNPSKGKEEGKSIIGLNEHNNLWLDLEGLLRFMVIYYNLQESDVEGELEVCIKLDEMELSHAKKYERVSLTLMNKALLSSYEEQGKLKKKERDPEWFSVQSEDHTWWLGLFQVRKENHDVLKWVFEQTTIPALIHKYHSGEKLIVEGFGAFLINFHMASDLKTEKCMYNISNTGAKASKNCIYCNYTLKSSKKGHSRSTLDCDQLAAPDRHINDKMFQPILPIPLERVHVCTLHALVRIVDKMIHHSACFVWNIRNEEDRKEGIKRVEKVLSDAGLHGGCVKLEKDTKKSNGRSSIPAKVSIGGDKARHFLSKVDSAQRGDFEFGKMLVYAEHDRTETTAKKLNAWNALSDLNVLLQKHFFTESNKQQFRAAVNAFTTAYIQAWGESEVTHYIHIIYAHGPWFAQKYGSLAIWNTQGMEKSHKQAKVAFNQKTQRGGCNKSSLSNPLVQMTQWFYRRIIARHEENMVRRASPNVPDATMEAAKKRRRETWENSEANDRDEHLYIDEQGFAAGNSALHVGYLTRDQVSYENAVEFFQNYDFQNYVGMQV